MTTHSIDMHWTTDQLITMSEIKRVYKLKETDIIGVDKVITKRNPCTVKYVKSEVLEIADRKAKLKKEKEEFDKEYPAVSILLLKHHRTHRFLHESSY